MKRHGPELMLPGILFNSQRRSEVKDGNRMKIIHGMAPLIASVTVRMIIKALSAIGSITLPATVCSFHLRAIHPSTRSVIPAYAKSASAHL